MVFLEEDGLAVVGALAGCLEVEPLFCVEGVWGSRGETEAVRRVVELG